MRKWTQTESKLDQKLESSKITQNLLLKNYADNDKEYYHDNRVETSSAGRIMGRRGPFIILKDSQGSFQVYITKGSNETMEDFASKLDIGDIIFVAGTVMKTNTGQVSIRAEEISNAF